MSNYYQAIRKFNRFELKYLDLPQASRGNQKDPEALHDPRSQWQ